MSKENPQPQYIFIEIENGIVDVRSRIPIKVVVIDRDVEGADKTDTYGQDPAIIEEFDSRNIIYTDERYLKNEN